MNTQVNQQPTTKAEVAGEAMAAPMLQEPFTFRSIAVDAKDGRFAKEVAKFEAAGVKFEVTAGPAGTDEAGAAIPGEVQSIKRVATQATFRQITVAEMSAVNPAFVQQLLDKQVYDLVKGKFIDECLPIDNAAITPAALIAMNASRREAAISKEQLAAVVKVIVTHLIEKATPQGSQDIILTIVKGKFGKMVLDRFDKHAKQYPDLLAMVISAFTITGDDGVPVIAEQHREHEPVLLAFGKNLTTYLESEEEDLTEIFLG